MPALSTSNSEPATGRTTRAVFAAVILLILVELVLSAPSQPGEERASLPTSGCDILVVGDSRAATLDVDSLASAFDPAPDVCKFTLDGSNAEMVARFAMKRQEKPPALLVICVSYSGWYASPHETRDRLRRLSDWSELVDWKNSLKESLQKNLVLYLDAPVLDRVKSLRTLVKGRADAPPAGQDQPPGAPEADKEPEPLPTIHPLDLLAVHNQYRTLGRRVVPAYRRREFGRLIKEWKREHGTDVVFLRLPVAGRLKEIEETLPFENVLQDIAREAGVPYLDTNDTDWVKELRPYMADESHVSGGERRRRMSRLIGEMLRNEHLRPTTEQTAE